MMSRGVVVCVPGLVLFIAASLLPWSTPAEEPAVLEPSSTLRWYRGNLHTHSNWSDGDDYLESIALWYRDRGYQFLSITDHNILAQGDKWVTPEVSKGGWTAYNKLKERFADRPGWIVERTRHDRLQVKLKTFQEVSRLVNVPDEFLLIQGEEISDRYRRLPIHLNATNVAELIVPRHGESVREVIQNNVDAVLAERERSRRPMLVHLNHPNFGYAVTAEDLMHIVGDRFFEVYNGHPAVHNQGDAEHPGTERIWDVVLTWRLAELGLPVMYGLAVDDGHDYHDRPGRNSKPGRGWVMVLAHQLTPASLIAALESGRFYASSGVTLRRIESSQSGLTVDVQPVEGESYTIEFVGTRTGFDRQSTPLGAGSNPERTLARRYSADVGQVLASVEGTHAEYRFQGDEIYVRARVTSSARHPNPSEPGEFQRAWVQPVLGPGFNNAAP